MPLPDELEPSPLGVNSRYNLRVDCCSRQIFVDVHPEHSNNTPFLQIKAGHPYNVDMAKGALKGMEAFDADERVLVIIAHDYTLLPFLSFFPEDANKCFEDNCKSKSRWVFLKDMAQNVEDRASN